MSSNSLQGRIPNFLSPTIREMYVVVHVVELCEAIANEAHTHLLSAC